MSSVSVLWLQRLAFSPCPRSKNCHNLNQNQPHQQPNPNSITTSPTGTSSSTTTTATTTLMWNPREHQEDEDDSWEVRAFAEDTKNIMGTTWPPRSYTCTFCRREFRSAQALGGHMNVHRRDRARLHHHHHPPPNPTTTTTSSFINIPPQELVANDGLCLLYHLPSPNSSAPLFSTHHTHNNTILNACGKSPSTTTLLNVSSYPSPNCWEKRGLHKAEEITQIKGKNKPFLLEEQNAHQLNLMMMSTSSPCLDFPIAQVASNGFSSSCSHSGSSKVEEPTTSSTHEELDLELRLGHRST